MKKPTCVYAVVSSPEHDLPTHPENAARFSRFEEVIHYAAARNMHAIEPRPASAAAVTAVHPATYLQALEEAAAQGPAYIDLAPTYVTPASYLSAINAAGAVLEIVDHVLSGKAEMGFALIRPPGHHATPTRAMGFCLLNNVAIAARYAQSRGARRVMIVDFDVHHGNGTQDVFESDPDVLYLSTHQWGIYPGSGEMGDTGRGRAAGNVINIPLPGGAGDQAFAAIADGIILPAGRRFAPDVIIVSAGFDAHWADPLAGLQLSCAGFYQLASRLTELALATCQGRLVLSLEGGYDPSALAASIVAILAGIGGNSPPPDAIGPAPASEPDVSDLVANVAALHRLGSREEPGGARGWV